MQVSTSLLSNSYRQFTHVNGKITNNSIERPHNTHVSCRIFGRSFSTNSPMDTVKRSPWSSLTSEIGPIGYDQISKSPALFAAKTTKVSLLDISIAAVLSAIASHVIDLSTDERVNHTKVIGSQVADWSSSGAGNQNLSSISVKTIPNWMTLNTPKLAVYAIDSNTQEGVMYQLSSTGTFSC